MAKSVIIIEQPYREVRERLSEKEVETAVKKHVETLPQWLQDLEIDWLYKEIAHRRSK